MATFEYNALTSTGRLMRGTIEAASAEQASQMLKDMQLTINEIEKAREHKPKTAIGRSEFMLFNQQLASITKAGIPLERGLRELANDVASKSMRKLIIEIADELASGVSIEHAVENRQKHFPALYGQILKAGVETGRLSEMLTSLNRHLEVGTRTRRIIIESLCYPAVVLVLIAVIFTFLFTLVIPSFKPILVDLSGDISYLPAITQTVLSVPDYIIPFWITVFILIGALLVVNSLLSSNPSGRRFRESIFLKLPLIGKLYHCGLLARIAEAMAMLVGSGCGMPDCLRLSAGSTGSEKMKLECEALAGGVEQGNGFMEAGHMCRLLPRLFLYSVQLGSQRNELQDNLYSLGQMYGQQTHSYQTRLQTVLMPALIICLGVLVATIVLALFLPMIKLLQAMS